MIEEATKEVARFGKLASYDVAHRIGAYLNLVPDYIYLYAGTADGAKALGLWGDKVEKSKFPKSLQRLSPAQIEDFLCIFKNELSSRSKISFSDENIRQVCMPRVRFTRC